MPFYGLRGGKALMQVKRARCASSADGTGHFEHGAPCRPPHGTEAAGARRVLLQPVRRMTSDAVLRDPRQRLHHRRGVVRCCRAFRNGGEFACRCMHAKPDRPHRVGHVECHHLVHRARCRRARIRRFRLAGRSRGRVQPEMLDGDLRSVFVLGACQGVENAIEGLHVVAHVAQHVHPHLRREVHEHTAICWRHVHMIMPGHLIVP